MGRSYSTPNGKIFTLRYLIGLRRETITTLLLSQRMLADMRKQHQTTMLKPWFLVKVTTQTTSRLSTINHSTTTKPPSTLLMAPLRTTPTLLQHKLLSTTMSRASEAMRLLTASLVKFAGARSTQSATKTSARGSMNFRVFSCH